MHLLQIYVVMEKMQGDMLEMILNSPESRLTERKTKFLIFQVVKFLFFLVLYIFVMAVMLPFRYWPLSTTFTLRILCTAT